MITPMSDEELKELTDRAGEFHRAATAQSYDRALMLTDLSEYDLEKMDDIIRNNYGDWFSAELMRCLHILLPVADSTNLDKLRYAYPGACAAYLAWYNGRLDKAVGDEG